MGLFEKILTWKMISNDYSEAEVVDEKVVVSFILCNNGFVLMVLTSYNVLGLKKFVSSFFFPHIVI